MSRFQILGRGPPSFPQECLQAIRCLHQLLRHDHNNVVYSCRYHVVFCPKYRRRVLVDGVDERLKEIAREVAEELSFEIIEMEVMPDHVHMLLEVDPQLGIHRAVKRIKGRTSHDLREEFPWLKKRLPSLWTNSYFVSTVGGAPLSAVKQYIESQKGV